MLGVLLAATEKSESWWTTNATLIVGVVGILVSGLVGPTVTALWTARREKQKDHRAAVSARRDDLRTLLDEAAKSLAAAVPTLRPLLQAHLAGEALPEGPRDFLSALFPLEQRLAIRVGGEHALVTGFRAAREALITVSEATGSQQKFDEAVKEFEAKRAKFLEAGRSALAAPIEKDTQI